MENMDTEKIGRAIAKLLDRDQYLLINNATERSITHKLALYLEDEYEGYDVDCEYNLNIINEDQRKIIYVLEEQYNRVKDELKRKKIKNIDGIEYLEISVYPDIIIHNRGNNDDNRIIFEIKKSNNLDEINYDRLKLKKYTSHDSEFKYRVGLFIIFTVAQEDISHYQLEEYCDGEIISSLTVPPIDK
jgi:hypothetical protein